MCKEIRYNSAMRKIIVALVLLLAIVFVFLRFSELKDFLNTLHHSNYRFLIAAFIVELIWMFNSATDYGSIYRLVGLKEKTSHLVLVATAANFVNVIAPSVGIGGMAVFLDDAARQNHSTGRVTVVGVLYILFDYLAFFCVLTLGFIVLIRRNNLNPGELTAAAILLVIAGAVAFLLYSGVQINRKAGQSTGMAGTSWSIASCGPLFTGIIYRQSVHLLLHMKLEREYRCCAANARNCCGLSFLR